MWCLSGFRRWDYCPDTETVHDTVSIDANISRLLVTSLPRVVVILRLHVE